MASENEPDKVVFSYSQRDLTVIPNEFDMNMVDTFIKAQSKSSGENHVNKGYKYWHEEFIHNINSKYILQNCHGRESVCNRHTKSLSL